MAPPSGWCPVGGTWWAFVGYDVSCCTISLLGQNSSPNLLRLFKKTNKQTPHIIAEVFLPLNFFSPIWAIFFLKAHKCTVHSSFFSCNVINPISTHHVPLPEKAQKESFLYLSFMPAQPLELWSFLNFENKATLLHNATAPLLHHFVNKVFPQTQRCLTSFCNELC